MSLAFLTRFLEKEGKLCIFINNDGNPSTKKACSSKCKHKRKIKTIKTGVMK
jgi:hypothetical protein